jgi:hypothetical protein
MIIWKFPDFIILHADTIFGRWERAADDAYIRNEIRSNIDVQTCNSYWYNFLAQGIAMNYCYPSTDMLIGCKSLTNLHSELIFLEGKPIFYIFLPSTPPY